MSRAEQMRDGQLLPLAQVESFEQDGVRVIAVSGELDISNIDLLKQAAFDLPNRALGVALDLTGTTHIDSATIRLLFEMQQGLARRRQALRVIYADSSAVQRVLELTAFEQGAVRAADRASAITAIRSDLPSIVD